MRLKYQNKTETLIIEINLEYKNNNLNQPIFSASGIHYLGHYGLTDKDLISAGQCLDCIPEFVKTMENKRKIKELTEIYELWQEWHLNDLKPWCKHMNYGDLPKTEIKLLNKECPICGAKYGHSWYYKPIPANVINKIKK